MQICGIDYSTHAVDVVLIEEDTDRATWERYELVGVDAFDRARSVKENMPGSSLFVDCVAIGIEQPRGYHGTQHLARIQGAILARIPLHKLVYPWNPAQWRKQVGLPGNASKEQVSQWTVLRGTAPERHQWPQDACDAYCIALATRQLLEKQAAA
jgi:hypothetical protein